MTTYTPEQLKEIIDLHGKWLRDEEGGKRADLRYAILTDAILTDANLRGADLRYAILTDADLRGANLRGAILIDIRSLWGTIGNMAEIKSIQADTWPVTYTATHMQIGCQLHPLGDWWAFDDKQIGGMDSNALEWWRAWKPLLQAITTATPAVPTERVE